ncbi:hypothetical protein pb186bvf_015847 [Paramecium bursaria]
MGQQLIWQSVCLASQQINIIVQFSYFSISIIYLMQDYGQKMVGSILQSYFLIVIASAVLHGLYLLAGDYFNTFIYMLLISLALISIRDNFAHSLDNYYRENKKFWKERARFVYWFHTVKFSYSMSIVIYLIRNLRQGFKGVLNMLDFIFSVQMIPYAFVIYIFAWKLKRFHQLIILEILFWLLIDIIRLLKALVLLVITKFKALASKKQKQQPNQQKLKQNNQEHNDLFITWVKQSSSFNYILFLTFILGFLLLIPIFVVLIYNDLVTYKNDLIPKISQWQIPPQVQEYLQPEYLIEKLDNQQFKELYKVYQNYFNHTEGDYLVNVGFAKIFYGENTIQMLNLLNDCVDSRFCQLKMVATNYHLINDEFQDYISYGGQYLNQFLPQIKQFSEIILKSILGVLSESVSYLVKFLLFFQGVLYLLGTKGSGVHKFLFLNFPKEFEQQLTNNIKKYISGTFTSIFLIFAQHYMISFILFDVLQIGLTNLLSLIIGILSLIQIVDPAIAYIAIVSIWQGFRIFNNGYFTIWDPNLALVLIICLTFYVTSMKIYQKAFKNQLEDEYWTGMSLVLGYLAFKLQGLIIGPLLIGATRCLVDILRWYSTDGKQYIQQEPVEQYQEEQVAATQVQDQQKKKKKKENK